MRYDSVLLGKRHPELNGPLTLRGPFCFRVAGYESGYELKHESTSADDFNPPSLRSARIRIPALEQKVVAVVSRSMPP